MQAVIVLLVGKPHDYMVLYKFILYEVAVNLEDKLWSKQLSM